MSNKINYFSLFIIFLAGSIFCQPVKAQSLEVVFKDVLWGAAIGSTVMFALWASEKEPETDKLGTKILQGAAYGTFGGLAYGIWDANKGTSLLSMEGRGLFQYDSMEHRLIIAPAEAMIATDLDGKSQGLRLSLLSTFF